MNFLVRYARHLALWLLAALSLGLPACKSSPNETPTPDAPATGTLSTEVMGRVLDETGAPVAGALVAVGGQQTTSAANGAFSLPGLSVSADRCVVQATKSGFFTAVVGVAPITARTAVQVVLSARGTPLTLASAAAGGTLSLPGGGSIDFPTNALTDGGATYGGQVRAYVRYLSPTDRRLRDRMPGGDFRATTTAGDARILTSYGAMRVELEGSNGQPLQLVAGKTATLRFPVVARQAGTAPASMPLWHFDEATGLWKEEGAATRQGSEYVGTVSHFSSWNADQASRTARLCLRVAVADSAICPTCPRPDVRLTIVRLDSQLVTVPAGGNGALLVDVPSGPFPGDAVYAAPADNNGIGSANRLQPGDLPAQQTTCIGTLLLGPLSALKQQFTGCTSTAPDGTFELRYADGTVAGGEIRAGQLATWARPSQPATLVVSVAGASTITRQITTAAAGQVLNLGTTATCGVNTVAFTIDGDGHQNERVELRDVPAYYDRPKGFYYSSYQATAVQMGRSTDAGYTTANFVFGGNTPGSYPTLTTPAGTTSLQFNVNAANSTPSIGYEAHSTAPFTIVVTRYDAVGGRIQGTFSGTLTKRIGTGALTSTTVTISNGTFDVPRTADQ